LILVLSYLRPLDKKQDQPNNVAIVKSAEKDCNRMYNALEFLLGLQPTAVDCKFQRQTKPSGFDFAKVKITSTEDPLEKEADHVADRVSEISKQATNPFTDSQEVKKTIEEKAVAPLVLTKARTTHINLPIFRRIGLDRSESSEVPPIVQDALRVPGQRLDDNFRTFIESLFRTDLSQVRIHTDYKAAESSKALHAKAYTLGHNIVFGENQYNPKSEWGKRLIAHELAHVIQQETCVAGNENLIERAALEEELNQELEAWAENNKKKLDPNNYDYAFTLQEYAWNLIAVPNNVLPIPKPTEKESLRVWQKNFQKAQLIAGMILQGGSQVEQKETRAGMILNIIAQAGFTKEAVALAKPMKDPGEIEYVYRGVLDSARSADPQSLTVITEFFIEKQKKGETSNPIIEKLTDKSGSFERTLDDSRLNAILKPIVASYENDEMILDLLSEVLVHKPKYRKVFSDWMWKEGKQNLLFRVLESKYFVEPGYGPDIFAEVGELELEKDMPWVYANKQKYYVNYIVQLGQESGVNIQKPNNLKILTLRRWLDENTEKISQALAKKYPDDTEQWIKVYEQITDIFFFHVSGRNIIPDPAGKLAKLLPGAPQKMRLKVDCDVLSTYAMRYFFGIKDPTKPELKWFEPVGYMAIEPSGDEGHSVALMRRDGRYYVISNKEVFPTDVVEEKFNAKKEAGIKEMKRIGFEVYENKPSSYKIYYANAIEGGAMPESLMNTEETTRRRDLEP
jgi:hypothetical protein